MSEKLVITVTAELVGALHIGGGKGATANTSYVLRDDHQRAYIPGSTLKGKLRHTAMLLQETKDSSAHIDGNIHCKCDVCTLFGAPGNSRGRLHFGPLVSNVENYTEPEYRVGNQVDRARNVVEDNKLFTIEAVSTYQYNNATKETATAKFTGCITVYGLTDDQKKLFMRVLIKPNGLEVTRVVDLVALS